MMLADTAAMPRTLFEQVNRKRALKQQNAASPVVCNQVWVDQGVSVYHEEDSSCSTGQLAGCQNRMLPHSLPELLGYLVHPADRSMQHQHQVTANDAIIDEAQKVTSMIVNSCAGLTLASQ